MNRRSVFDAPPACVFLSRTPQIAAVFERQTHGDRGGQGSQNEMTGTSGRDELAGVEELERIHVD